jgi:hypothetical protein
MSLIQKLLNKIRRTPSASATPLLPPRLASPPGDILIDSGLGVDGKVYVPEGARVQAAVNMRKNPALRAEVEALLGRKLGDPAKGIAESKRRYPEAYR